MNCTAEGRTNGPTPWYHPKFANGQHVQDERRWKKVDFSINCWRVCLSNNNNDLLILLHFGWYACAINNETFLLWREYRANVEVPNQPAEVQFHLLNINRLSAVTNVEEALVASDYSGSAAIYYAGEPVAKKTYRAAFPLGRTKVSAPSQFTTLGNVLVIADIGSSAGYDAPVHTAILDFNFAEQSVTCYPQDWFNKASLDFGYQWINRVWRDEKGRIRGEGVRLGEFRLDSSGQHIDRSSSN